MGGYVFSNPTLGQNIPLMDESLSCALDHHSIARTYDDGAGDADKALEAYIASVEILFKIRVVDNEALSGYIKSMLMWTVHRIDQLVGKSEAIPVVDGLEDDGQAPIPPLSTGQTCPPSVAVMRGAPPPDAHDTFPSSSPPVPPSPGRYIRPTDQSYSMAQYALAGLRNILNRSSSIASPSSDDSSFVSYSTIEGYPVTCLEYAPRTFRSLRAIHGSGAKDLRHSITCCDSLRCLPSPGRSGAHFFFTEDDHFVMKRITREEQVTLSAIVNDYLEHVSSQPHSLLVRLYAMFSLRNGGGMEAHFLVMENLYPPSSEVSISEVYDLKGSTVSRSASPKEMEKRLPVQKDNDFVRNRRLWLGPLHRTLLLSQLHRDCTFLARLGIMDYSLLVLVHRPAHPPPLYPYVGKDRSHFRNGSVEGGFFSSKADDAFGEEVYFLGIIDVLQVFNWKKKLEGMYKGLMGESSNEISCVEPGRYADRLVMFIGKHIESG